MTFIYEIPVPIKTTSKKNRNQNPKVQLLRTLLRMG